MHDWLFKDIHFERSKTLAILAIDLLKLNNAGNTCLNENVRNFQEFE